MKLKLILKLVVISCLLFFCIKKEKKKLEEKEYTEIFINKLDIKIKHSLTFLKTNWDDFLKESKGTIQINSVIKPKKEDFEINLNDPKGQITWQWQNNNKDFTLNIKNKNDEKNYSFTWLSIVENQLGVADIQIKNQKQPLWSIENLSSIKDQDEIVLYDEKLPTISDLIIFPISPNTQITTEKILDKIKITLNNNEKENFVFYITNQIKKMIEITGIIKDTNVLIIDQQNNLIEVELKNKNTYIDQYTYYIKNKTTGNTVKTETMDGNQQNKFQIAVPLGLFTSKFRKNDNFFIEIDLSFSDQQKLSIEKNISYWFVAKTNIPIIDIVVENEAEPSSSKEKHNANYSFYDQSNTNEFLVDKKQSKQSSGTINVRGSTSAGFPKKSYTFSLANELDLLGMPKHKKWTVIGGFVDKTHLANFTAYRLYKEMGHYAQNSEIALVYLNGEYRGLYSFLEKIEQGTNRIPTDKNTGFILQLENCCIAWVDPTITLENNVKYTYVYPSNPTFDQQNKIKISIDNYINALKNKKNWRDFYNEQAEIDLFILNEIFANVDGYGNAKNVIYFLNQNNKIEPIAYDFVASLIPPYFSNINSSWNYIMNQPALIYTGNNFPLLTYYKQDPSFTNNLKARYRELRGNILSDAAILSIINPLIEKLNTGKHYQNDMDKWTELNYQRYTAEQFKEKLLQRLRFVDNQWK